MAGIMKRAEEIYKALEKTMEFLVEAGTACIGVNADAEAVRDLADSKDEVCSSNGRYAIDYAIKQISSVAVEKVSDVDCLINKAIEAAEEGLEEPEAEKANTPTEAELRDSHRVETYEVPPEENENPQAILDKLYFAVKETRAGADVTNITFTKPGEAVIYVYTGASKRVNIECDSGIAMIVDVCRALM